MHDEIIIIWPGYIFSSPIEDMSNGLKTDRTVTVMNVTLDRYRSET